MYNNFNNYGATSFTPASQGSQYQGFQKQYQPVGYVQSFYGQNAVQANQGYGQSATPESYHTASYRGNQLGHDTYLRADSINPAQHQSGFQSGYSSFANTNNTSAQFGMNQSQNQSQYGFRAQQQPFTGNQFGRAVTSNQSYIQAAAPESYHTANYRGNQMGHDTYLRADSFNPAQQQAGSFQTGYGTQGTQSMSSFNTGINNVSQQFGYNSAY